MTVFFIVGLILIVESIIVHAWYHNKVRTTIKEIHCRNENYDTQINHLGKEIKEIQDQIGHNQVSGQIGVLGMYLPTFDYNRPSVSVEEKIDALFRLLGVCAVREEKESRVVAKKIFTNKKK